MLKFTLSRALTGALVVFTVATITFFLLRTLPGGPFDEDKTLPPEIQRNIEKKYRLDEPVWKQYLYYIYDLSRGEFGPSYKYIDRSVNDIIKNTLPVSVKLGAVGFALVLSIGGTVGVLSSVRPRGLADFAGVAAATTLVSVPSFVVGALLMYFFSVRLGWLPAALWGRPEHFVLPALTLAVGPAAYLSRLIRGSMLETSGSAFIRTARAKGLGQFKIVLKHVLKNALIPILTVLGPIAAFLVTGSFVVEHIFEIPGMGKFFVIAVSNRDYPLVMGITVIYTVILVLANFVVDLSYALIDPRITFEKQR
ncbi:MAG: ABC transporter permease [Thermodesulfobacteriota bacterium]